MAAAVVVGGAGALGSAIVRALRRQQQTNLRGLKQQHQNTPLTPIVSVDYRPCPCPEATHSVVLPSTDGAEPWDAAGERAVEEVRALLEGQGQEGCGSVFHAAGGWAGGCVSCLLPACCYCWDAIDRMDRSDGSIG